MNANDGLKILSGMGFLHEYMSRVDVEVVDEDDLTFIIIVEDEWGETYKVPVEYLVDKSFFVIQFRQSYDGIVSLDSQNYFQFLFLEAAELAAERGNRISELEDEGISP